jgi:predicted HicB family RNase H-like nuclease
MTKRKPTRPLKLLPFLIRVDPKDLERFKVLAAADGRSVSSWIVQRCREAAKLT